MFQDSICFRVRGFIIFKLKYTPINISIKKKISSNQSIDVKCRKYIYIYITSLHTANHKKSSRFHRSSRVENDQPRPLIRYGSRLFLSPTAESKSSAGKRRRASEKKGRRDRKPRNFLFQFAINKSTSRSLSGATRP